MKSLFFSYFKRVDETSFVDEVVGKKANSSAMGTTTVVTQVKWTRKLKNSEKPFCHYLNIQREIAANAFITKRVEI